MRYLFASFLVLLLLADAGLSQTADSVPQDAERLDSLRSQFLIPAPPRDMFKGLLPRSSPSMGANSPSAFGGSTGDAFIGANYTRRARYVSVPDGAAAAGFSLGSPARSLGVDITVLSHSTMRTGFMRNGGIDLQLNRELPGGWGIALGWENPINWGYEQTGSPYGVISKWLQLREDSELVSAMMVTFGAGSGRFQSEAAYLAGKHGINAFGSVALRLSPAVSGIADWTGQDLTVLGSIAPFNRIAIVVSGGVADITRNAGDGRRLVFAGGWSFNVLDWFD